MKKIYNTIWLGCAVMGTLLLGGCEEFLDQKPDQRLTIPERLEDLQALMDDHTTFGTETNAGEISSDDFYVIDANLTALSSDWDRRTYTWEADHLFGPGNAMWGGFGQSVYYANYVLEQLERIGPEKGGQASYDNIKGSAKLVRARRLFQASLIWNLVYNEATADADLGMPLRKNTNFNEVSVRSSLEETYRFILSDLKSAAVLLPELPIHVVRPSRAAAFALLARVYLYMGRYEEAGRYADSCLQIQNTLLDYNGLNPNAAYPVARYNLETIWYYGMPVGQIFNLNIAKINPEVYAMFEDTDLRKRIFFTTNADGSNGFKGRYTGAAALFPGLATDEIFLIRAECHARRGDVELAIADINHLLSARYSRSNGVSFYQPITSGQADEILEIVLKERRKQLIFRGLRWYDLKRFNRDGANITLRRVVNGEEYLLPPNDLRYALPFPEDVIALSGMEQNPR